MAKLTLLTLAQKPVDGLGVAVPEARTSVFLARCSPPAVPFAFFSIWFFKNSKLFHQNKLCTSDHLFWMQSLGFSDHKISLGIFESNEDRSEISHCHPSDGSETCIAFVLQTTETLLLFFKKTDFWTPEERNISRIKIRGSMMQVV